MTLKYGGQHVFRTGQRLVLGTKPKTKPKQKEDSAVNDAAKTIINTLAEGILNRMQDEKQRLAASQPDPPPPVILEPTEVQKEVRAHYEDKINTVHSASGREAYLPPPVLLAPMKED